MQCAGKWGTCDSIKERNQRKRGGVCWGSLVRRHIKAIQLIDEAFYKWRVKSSCHSLSFCWVFFSAVVSLSFTSSCFPVISLPLSSPPTVPTSHLNWRAAVARASQSLPLPCWGQQNLCFSKPQWYLPLWGTPKRLKCTLFQPGWDAGSPQSLGAINKARKLNHRQQEPGLQRILAPRRDKCSTERLLCCVYKWQ